jgi:hypothetical protein
MYLLRYSDLYKEAAEISDIPESIIRLVCNHYFFTVKSKFWNMEHMAIQCPGLGNFYIWSANFKAELMYMLSAMKSKKAKGEPISEKLIDKFRAY